MKEMRIYVNGHKTNYTVTKSGIVYSLDYGRTGEKKALKHCMNKDTGYECVNIYYKKKLYRKYVHRLVAEAFIPNPKNKPEVNHKDGNIHNNHVTNLEWATEKENTDHAFKHKLRYIHYGDDAPSVKINKKIAKKVCEKLEENVLGIREISDELNISPSIVKNIKDRKCWVEVSKEFNINNHTVRSKPKKHKKTKSINITEKDVKKICKMLDNGFHPKEIEKITGIKRCKINSILYGNAWTKISKDYDFIKNKKKGGEKYIQK